MNWLALHISAFFMALSAFLGFGGGVAWTPATTTQPVACTQEAKQCPDGSYVGRTGPNCAFAPCPTSPAPTPTPKPTPTPTPMPIPAAVSIVSIQPSSGSVGATVTIGGSGFTSDNIIHFGAGAIAHVASSQAIFNCPMMPAGSSGTCGSYSQILTFTVPSAVGPYCAPGTMCPMYMQEITPGTYTVYVQNANGSSNSVSFTVTGAGSLQPLSVNGLDAPTTLALGQVGTWTVHVSANAGTQLHYSVVWGDEAAQGSAIMAPAPSNIQTSATFTHAYERSGTYTPTFTVTDDTGASTSVSGSITVTPLY